MVVEGGYQSSEEYEELSLKYTKKNHENYSTKSVAS